MRLLIQRVGEASVTIEGNIHSAIDGGLLVFVGIEEADTAEDIAWLISKLVKLRIFADKEGVMNLSAAEVSADILVVSQFTLHASTRKGNRPSYIRAARPEQAIPLYEQFIVELRQELYNAIRDAATVDTGVERIGTGKVLSGVFGADMQVALINDGPVTIWIDSKNRE